MRAIGIDLIEIEEVRDSLHRFGAQYLQRVFTPRERAACGASAGRLAEVFAAKEATFKALDGPQVAMSWQTIEIDLDAGSGTARLSGPLRSLSEDRGVSSLRVDVSRDRRQALAVAVVEARR